MYALLTALGHRLVSLAPLFVLGLGIERALGARWRPRHLAFNLAVTVIFWAFHVAAGAALTAWVGHVFASLPGSGVLHLPSADTTLGLWLGVFLFVLANDFGFYWTHRLQHRSAWLWAQHELHHSDEHMHVATAYRHHWLEFVVQGTVIAAPFAYLVRAPVAVMVAWAVVNPALTLFIHMDAPIRLRRWAWLMVTPQMHRIHHSRAREHRDKNFAGVFPIWDVLFGTYYAPQPDEYPATGVDAVVTPLTLPRAVVWPFLRWSAMLTRRGDVRTVSAPRSGHVST